MAADLVKRSRFPRFPTLPGKVRAYMTRARRWDYQSARAFQHDVEEDRHQTSLATGERLGTGWGINLQAQRSHEEAPGTFIEHDGAHRR